MKISITCKTCHKTHQVDRTKEIPENAISMGCNWCPDCEDRADDYYSEWYNYEEDGYVVADNQLLGLMLTTFGIKI